MLPEQSPCTVVVHGIGRHGQPRPRRRWLWSKYSSCVAATSLRAVRGVLEHSSTHVPQLLVLIPWLLVVTSSSSGSGYDLSWLLDQHFLLALVVLPVAFAALLALREHLRAGGVAEPLLAASALLMWHLGFQAPGSSERYCLAVMQARGRTSFAPVDGRHAAVGLMLLDDMLRAIFRYVAGTPQEAWPFALVNRRMNWLWTHDEAWWEACYNKRSWMRLPLHPKLLHGEQQSSSQCMLREAMLWASMVMETLGTMVMLPPRCATPCWIAAPCIASTLLVFSCAPWLPRQSDMVLVAMLQLVRNMSRFAIYFQAVWIFVAALLLQNEDFALCSMREDQITLRVLELVATVAMYVMVFSHLLAVTSWCRVASPMYAVLAEDVVPADPRRGRPLYCGSLGLVEGFHAPTRMFNNEDLGVSVSSICWRDRYALRQCTEFLTAREAQLLSSLEALDLRIEEAEVEAEADWFPPSGRSGMSWRAATVPSEVGKQGLAECFTGLGLLTMHPMHIVLAMATCAMVAHGYQTSCYSERDFSSLDRGRGLGLLEAMLWASLLLRAGHGWYSIMARSAMAWEPSSSGHSTCQQEVTALRQQAIALHRSLAETQWTIYRLEAQLKSLGVTARRPHSHPDGCRSWGAMRVLTLSWLSSIVALALVPCLR